jgi:subtilisin family serine protease
VRRFAWISLVALVCTARGAHADFDFARVRGALQRETSERPVPPVLANSPGQRVGLLLERRQASASAPPGAVPAGNGFFSLTLSLEQARSFEPAPGFVSHWAPARHLLLDRALSWARVPEFRSAFENPSDASGRGVIVGLVDTGIDLEHPDFRAKDGASRVLWLIDFTRPPAQLPGGASLEDELDCAGERACAVYSASDLASVRSNTIAGDEPRDTIGHGTHVASLAASSGLSQASRTYAGVAPEADLVIARVTDGQAGISDPVIIDAVRFVFDRARALGKPAVVNLSLGSDLGAHDGSSALERALAGFVGPSEPGRAIVVAAGNSAGLYRSPNTEYPGPFGVHTEVHVPRESPTRVAVLTPERSETTTRGRISVWIALRDGDDLAIGLERHGRAVGSLVAAGSVDQFKDGDVRMLVLNGAGAAGTEALADNAAILIIDGEWTSGETFGLRFEGHGTASMWVEGAGDVDPAVSVGPLFPLAQKEGTINIPASASELIAVGATLNRTDWVDSAGIAISQPENGGVANSPADTVAYFSSAGPNAPGGMKPDIVASGTNVVGAMASLADPRSHPQSMFSGVGLCEGTEQCLVVDDLHAIASGTSMASPLVAGVVALLFQQNPALTQPEVRTLLQAGARRLEGGESFEPQVGPGALDARGSLDALLGTSAGARLPGAASWLSLGASFARPDPSWPLFAYAELRDDASRPADGFAAHRLSLELDNAQVLEPLQRLAPGLYRFALAAPSASGGKTLSVRLLFDGVPISERTLPIAVDRGALVGLAMPRGGCGFARRPPSGSAAVLALGAFGAFWLHRRRSAFRRAS